MSVEGRALDGRGVLERAFVLLEELAAQSEVGLSALASACALPKATVHRLLDQLCAVGAVERRGERYRMGYRAFELGQAWQPYPRLHVAAREPVRALVRASGASVALCVLRGGRTVMAGGTPGALGPVLPIGTSYPWSTAAGKVLVAFGRAEELTNESEPGGWGREAAAIRRDGIAVDHGEVLPGVGCLAVPVRAAEGTVVAALTAMVTMPALTTGLEQGLRRAADAIIATLRTG